MCTNNSRRKTIDALAAEIAGFAGRLNRAEYQLLTALRAFEAIKGYAAQGAASCASWLSWRVGMGIVAARERVRVAVRLGELPLIDEQFRNGQLSYCKVRAMVRVADPDNESLLVAQARGTTGDELERICAGFRAVVSKGGADQDRRYARRRRMADGTVQIELRLLPDEADLVWQTLQEKRRQVRAERRSHQRAVAAGPLADVDRPIAERREEANGVCREPRRSGAHSAESTTDSFGDSARCGLADAAMAIFLDGAKPAAERTLLMVHLSERKRSSDDWQATLHDGTAIGGATLRRMACGSSIMAVHTVTHGDGRANEDEQATHPTAEPMDLGRRRRTVSPRLLLALKLRDRGCRFPGCGHRAYVDAHHIHHWMNGGKTSLSHAVLLCHFHHVAVHEGGFRVERRAAGLTFRDPQGHIILAAPTLEGVPPISATDTDVADADDPGLDAPTGRGLMTHRMSLARPEVDGCVRALCRRYFTAQAEA